MKLDTRLPEQIDAFENEGGPPEFKDLFDLEAPPYRARKPRKGLLPDKRRVRDSIRLPPDDLAFVKAYGEGSLTRGVAAMIRVCRHLQNAATAQAAAAVDKRKG